MSEQEFELWIGAFEGFSPEQVRDAAKKYLATESGQYFPMPGSLIALIPVEEVDVPTYKIPNIWRVERMAYEASPTFEEDKKRWQAKLEKIAGVGRTDATSDSKG